MTLVFQLFASHAGRQEKSGRKFLPARARVNLQKSLSPVSPCHPEAGAYEVKVSYLRYKSQLLTIRKSVTCDAKDSYLRKWFKYGLKAQKLLEAARPERAEAPSPGHRPGYNGNQQGAL